METLKRLSQVPWLHRIIVALCILIPVLCFLYYPPVAAVTIWCICMVAAKEHTRLRSASLKILGESISKLKKETEDDERENESQDSSKIAAAFNAAYSSPLHLMACCSAMFVEEALDGSSSPGFLFLTVAACVSFSIVATNILTYAWHPEIPESRDALLYAWTCAGLDLYFLSHYAVPLALGSFILRRSGGLPLGISLIVTSAAGDSGALLLGSAFGRVRFVRRLSPNKTLAGILGSLFLSFLITAILWHLSRVYPHLGLLPAALTDYLTFGAITSIIGLFGDLVESAYKRCAGVKDSSSLFGPHGGMLDRLDSMVLPIPFIVLFLASRGLLGLPSCPS